MTRLTPLILAVALLGCRDTSDLEIDALESEVSELTARLEALEADAAAGDTALLDVQSNAEATAADIAALEAEVAALATVDLTDTLDAIEDVDDRVASLEEAGFTTETWVEAQEYMTQAAGETLDARITANADSADSNSALIATNTSSLSTQLASISANAASASSNAQALSSVDARVTVAEATAGQAQTDAARIDAALLTVAADVSDLDDGVATLDDAVDDLTDRVDTAEAAVGGAADQFTALTDADIELQSAIDDVATQASALAVDVSANQTSITSNTSGLSQATTARTALASDISANTDLVADVANDVSFNLGFIESNLVAIDGNTAAISNNTTAIANNTAGVELAIDTVADLEALVAGSTAELDDILTRLDLVEVYTDTQWVAANTATSSDDGAIGPMQLEFTKQLEDSILYVQYADNLRTTGGNKACRWEVYFNGQSCTSPGRVAGDLYALDGNSHEQGNVDGYCRGTSAGEFGARDVAVSVRVAQSPGYSGSDCHTGWRGDQLGVLRVTEAVDPE